MFLTIQNSIVKEDPHQYNGTITIHEIQNALKQLRATSPGLDDIDNTILKNLPINYTNYLLKLFNKSWFSESLPNSWKMSLLVATHY